MKHSQSCWSSVPAPLCMSLFSATASCIWWNARLFALYCIFSFLGCVGEQSRVYFPWLGSESLGVISLCGDKDISFLQIDTRWYSGEGGGYRNEERAALFFSFSPSCTLLGYRWERQLVFRSKLTMHTAFDRKDNAHPAEITALGISKWVAHRWSLSAFFQCCQRMQTLFFA